MTLNCVFPCQRTFAGRKAQKTMMSRTVWATTQTQTDNVKWVRACRKTCWIGGRGSLRRVKAYECCLVEINGTRRWVAETAMWVGKPRRRNRSGIGKPEQ
jgi:hypothetical protein